MAQSANIGVTSLLPNIDQGNAGLILAEQATLSQAATLQSISFYIETVDGTIRFGLYDSTGSNGNPGNKLAETPDIAPVAGWAGYWSFRLERFDLAGQLTDGLSRSPPPT